MDEAHRHIGFANGGEAGARLPALLHIPISAAGLLRRLKNTSLPANTKSPQFAGVDDWALRKGQRYGTIICDLQRHCPIDLLPDRSAESTARRLKEHPQVKVVSRDRDDPYIRGATQGAPNAIQVADRFHLVKNAHEALQRVVDRLSKMVGQTAQQIVKNKMRPPMRSRSKSLHLPKRRRKSRTHKPTAHQKKQIPGRKCIRKFANCMNRATRNERSQGG